MPNYTTDGTAAPIAPDAGQAPGLAPTLDLPADGEAADAASVAQAFKALGNHVAWLKAPKGKAGDFETPILPFKNARGLIVDRVDALGLVRGSSTWREDWPIRFYEHANTYSGGPLYIPFGLNTAGALSNNSDPLLGWAWGILNTTAYSATSLIQIFNSKMASGRVQCARGMFITTAPSVVDDAAGVLRNGTISFGTNLMLSLSFNISFVMHPGLICVGLVSGSNFDAAGLQGGIYVKLGAFDTTWRFVTRRVGGGASEFDSGVTAPAYTVTNVATRFRIVFIGSEIDFSSTSHAYLFINDVLVNSVTATLPAAGEIANWLACVKTQTPSGATLQCGLEVSEFEQQFWVLP